MKLHVMIKCKGIFFKISALKISSKPLNEFIFFNFRYGFNYFFIICWILEEHQFHRVFFSAVSVVFQSKLQYKFQRKSEIMQLLCYQEGTQLLVALQISVSWHCCLVLTVHSIKKTDVYLTHGMPLLPSYRNQSLFAEHLMGFTIIPL